MSEKEELVTVQVKVPKWLMDFIKAYANFVGADPDRFWEAYWKSSLGVDAGEEYILEVLKNVTESFEEEKDDGEG